MVGWGQAGHMLRALKNSFQALRSRLAGQQTARGGEGTLLFLECQPIHFSPNFLLLCPLHTPSLHVGGRALSHVSHFHSAAVISISLNITVVIVASPSPEIVDETLRNDWHYPIFILSHLRHLAQG